MHRLEPSKWIDNYADYLFAHALYRTHNHALSEDLVQDTLLSAYKARDQFMGGASEKTWLTRILKNKIIDHFRKQARSPEIPADSAYAYFFNNNTAAWNQHASPLAWDRNGLDQMEQKELSNVLNHCLSMLPPTWGQIAKMKWIDNESTETICKAFKITPSNLWVIMHRTKLQLRDCIEKRLLPSSS